jgi:hypothetical protein
VPDTGEQRLASMQHDMYCRQLVRASVLTDPARGDSGDVQIHPGGQASRRLVFGVENEAIAAVDVAAVGDLEDERAEGNDAFVLSHQAGALTAAKAR